MKKLNLLIKKNSVIVAGILTFGISLTAVATAVSAASGKITYISSVEDFKNIRNDLSGHYKVISSELYLREPWTPIGTEEEPFTGTFDGDGVTIYYLNFDSSWVENNDYCGLFGYNEGTIIHTNIWIGQDSTFSAFGGENYSFGLLAGINKGKVTSCYIHGYTLNVNLENGGFVGGLVGTNHGDIRNNLITSILSATADSGNLSLGMLAGFSKDKSVIELNSVGGGGSLSGNSPEGAFNCGLALGTMSGGIIQNNYLQKTNGIIGNSLDSSIGGIAGSIIEGASATVDSCCVDAPIVTRGGKNKLGGLIGSAVNNQTTVSNCLFTGSMDASNASILNYGELIGMGEVDVTNSYYTNEAQLDGTLNRIGEQSSLNELTTDIMGWNKEFWNIADGAVTFTRKEYS